MAILLFYCKINELLLQKCFNNFPLLSKVSGSFIVRATGSQSGINLWDFIKYS